MWTFETSFFSPLVLVLDTSGWVLSDSAFPVCQWAWLLLTAVANMGTPQLGRLRIVMQNGVKGPESTLHRTASFSSVILTSLLRNQRMDS